MRTRARPYTDPIFAGKSLGTDKELTLKRESLGLLRYVFSSAPVKRVDLLGPTFPLHRSKLLNPIPTFFTDDLASELRWTVASLLHNESKINLFIRLRSEFDNALLAAKYDQAEIVRAEIIERLVLQR